MNVVDSSGWLEYFADGPNARFFAKPIEERRGLLVPAPAFYEVFKRVLKQRDEHEALRAVAQMRVGTVVPLDEDLAIWAARISVAHALWQTA